jgi:uncharacterized protein (TIGR02246 family)
MSADLRQAIDDAWAAYHQATQAGDTAGALALWTPNARVLEPGMDLSGRDLHAFMEDFWKNGGEVFEFDREALEVFDHGDVAYEIMRYDETFRFPGGDRQTVHNFAFVRWAKQSDGTWKVDRILAGPRDSVTP